MSFSLHDCIVCCKQHVMISEVKDFASKTRRYDKTGFHLSQVYTMRDCLLYITYDEDLPFLDGERLEYLRSKKLGDSGCDYVDFRYSSELIDSGSIQM